MAHGEAVGGGKIAEFENAVGEVPCEVVGGTFDDVSGLFFGNDFGGTVGGSGEGGESTGEGLEDDVGEGIVERGEDEKVGGLVGFLDVEGGALEVDVVGDPELLSHVAVGGRFVAADDAEAAGVSGFADGGEGADDGLEALALEVLADEEECYFRTFAVVGVGGELGVIDSVVDDVDAILGVVIVFPDEGFGELGIGDDDAGVLGIHDGAFQGEDGAVAGVEGFDKFPQFRGVAEAHPIAVQGVRDAEGIGRVAAGKGDDLIDVEGL